MVVSYADAGCDSRQALVVVAPSKVWGPYALGGCGETLAIQTSDDGDSLVAMRMEVNPTAWVYTASDANFRGPVKVRLPARLQQLAQSAAKAPAIASTHSPAPERSQRPRTYQPPAVQGSSVANAPVAKPTPTPTSASNITSSHIKKEAPRGPQRQITIDLL
ncbi:MAG: hypothetical protein IPO00_06865 [Betaproteobacteria bacterium]|nr:hypothetical protein [Betaproteobacteria bacterium]